MVLTNTQGTDADAINLEASAGGIALTPETSNFVKVDGQGLFMTEGLSVTQLTSKTTGVTINARCGKITMYEYDPMSGGDTKMFTVTNNTCNPEDVIIITHTTGGSPGNYEIRAHAVNNNEFRVSVTCVSGSNLNNMVAMNFMLIKTTIT